MNFFSFFWVPLFYILWRSVFQKDRSGASGGAHGGLTAFFLGLLFSIVQFLIGDFFPPGGFGLSRWLYGFVDIVSFPVLLPMLICAVFVLVGILPPKTSLANFALAWIMPVAAFRALLWGELRDPILLMLVPVLWTAVAAGIHFFIKLAGSYPKWPIVVLCLLGILFMPIAGASAYWAFFTHQTTAGFVIFAAVVIPVLISFVLELLQAREPPPAPSPQQGEKNTHE